MRRVVQCFVASRLMSQDKALTPVLRGRNRCVSAFKTTEVIGTDIRFRRPRDSSRTGCGDPLTTHRAERSQPHKGSMLHFGNGVPVV